jgi:hypothetical protein
VSNATPQIDRYLAALREIVRQELARNLFGVFDYVVQSANGTTVDISPADPTIGAPSISGLVVWMGEPGSTCQPASGSHLAVIFLDGNRAKPRVIAFDATQAIRIVMAAQAIQLAGTTPIALGTPNDGNFQNILTWLANHTHPVPGVTAGPAAVVAGPAALTPPVIQTTAATKVQAQ